MTRRFPEGFLWGVATAGHQVEGGNRTSDTWFLEHTTPTVFREPSGHACDSWHRWAEDLDLAAGLGLTAFRFSVEWARVEPEPGRIDDAALAHYDAMVDGCLSRGLAPIVTLNHFTAPHWFAANGGWLDPAAPMLFAGYATRVVDRVGDRIACAITLNEPNLPRLLSWMPIPAAIRDLERATLEAAGRRAGVDRYRVANVVLPEDLAPIELGLAQGHIAARSAIRAARPGLPVGLAVAVVDDQVVGPDPSTRDRKRSEVYGQWLELAADDDFVGVQNYERIWYGPDGPLPPDDSAPRNHMGSAIEPGSLAGAVRYVHDATEVPVLVTEHGVGTADDAVRARFIEPSLAALLDVIDDGVPVLGYCHWSLLDNFEWIFGYAHRYGLFAVDRESLARTPKPSAATFAAIARAHGLNSPRPL